MGHAGWQVVRLWSAGPGGIRPQRWRIVLAGVLGVALLVVGSYGVLRRGFDRERRHVALTATTTLFDLQAYRWILASTPPHARFATEHSDAPTSELPVRMRTAFAVVAAGRSLVATHEDHSNPFTPWEPREAERQALLQAALGDGTGQILCQSAGPLWLILPSNSATAPERVEAVHETDGSTIYRVAAGHCLNDRKGL